MHLEDIHEAWVRHAGGIKESLRDHSSDGANSGTTTRMLLLPSFLQAFTDLAKTKYCNLHEGKGGNHLLLGDVFDNITNPTVSTNAFRTLTLWLKPTHGGGSRDTYVRYVHSYVRRSF